MRLGLLFLFAIFCAACAMAQSPPPLAVNAGYTNLVFDEQEKMFLILGAGAYWPVYVDYVRVWQ